ncbi:molecular chaperone GrpE [Halalkaliarchaeum desulfuricum]|uniref:Protein GrpE n=1 Tax=Halalkaliarchaeum desulfuricum TaxID=2055893 RepID=A0A343THW5_9EURY|nr:molecular chaperone GrpE [Halalkaliarchaeum desulfuricum]
MTEQAGDDTRETDAASTSTDAAEGSTAEGSTAEDSTTTDSADGAVGDRKPEFVERVAAHDEELAEAVEERISELEERVETLESELEEKSEEVDDLVSRLKRKQADFQNFKKRQKKKQSQLRERATEELVERLLPVRDNLMRALKQDEDADIRPGVESTLEQFDDVLDEENVEVIDPDPGEEIDPQRHEVMLKVDSEEPEDTIAELYQPGYEMGERVLRAAQVTVSNGTDSEKGDDGTDGSGDDEHDETGDIEENGDEKNGDEKNGNRDTADGDTTDESDPKSAEGAEGKDIDREE